MPLWPRLEMSRRRSRVAGIRGRAVVLGLVALALGLAGMASRAEGEAHGTRSSSVPPPDDLAGVWCVSSSFCMAVGGYLDLPQPGAVKWDGASWSVESLPAPMGAHFSDLAGISCPSSSECVAVGRWFSQSTGDGPLVESWDGVGWSIDSAPAPSASRDTRLLAVSCPTSTNCIAVGSQSHDGIDSLPLAESWNGTTWSVQRLPRKLHGALDGVACPRTGHCFAVGAAGVLRWDGERWSKARHAFGGPSAVSCVSRKDCTAVGSFGSTGNDLLSEYWNGRRWFHRRVAGGYNARLSSVSCASAGFCLAVGAYQSDSDSSAPIVARLHHGRWSHSPPGPAGADWLTAISCLSYQFCAAVGEGQNGYASLATLWNGTNWSSTVF